MHISRQKTNNLLFAFVIITMVVVCVGFVPCSALAQSYTVVSQSTNHNYTWSHTAPVSAPPRIPSWGNGWNSCIPAYRSDPAPNITDGIGGSSCYAGVAGFSYVLSQLTDQVGVISTVTILGPALGTGAIYKDVNITLSFCWALTYQGEIPFWGPPPPIGTLLGTVKLSSACSIQSITGSILTSHAGGYTGYSTSSQTGVDNIAFGSVRFFPVTINGVPYSQGVVSYMSSASASAQMDFVQGASGGAAASACEMCQGVAQ